MKTLRHLFQLRPDPVQRDSESVEVVSQREAARSGATFRAPALPTPNQFYSEVPFTVNFGPRLRERL
ncbi:MAG: hypothetical protein ABIQ12_05315 [Opitutaceae bacterium]